MTTEISVPSHTQNNAMGIIQTSAWKQSMTVGSSSSSIEYLTDLNMGFT